MGNGKTVLLIGASRGLGLGLAGELAGRGWQVIATARDPAKATELAALAERTGRVEIEKLDVDDVGQLEALATRIAGRQPGPVVRQRGNLRSARPVRGGSCARGRGEGDLDQCAFARAHRRQAVAAGGRGRMRGVHVVRARLHRPEHFGRLRAVSHQQDLAQHAGARLRGYRRQGEGTGGAQPASRLGAHGHGRPAGAGWCGRERARAGGRAGNPAQSLGISIWITRAANCPGSSFCSWRATGQKCNCDLAAAGILFDGRAHLPSEKPAVSSTPARARASSIWPLAKHHRDQFNYGGFGYVAYFITPWFGEWFCSGDVGRGQRHPCAGRCRCSGER